MNEAEKLNEISDFFHKMNNKIILIKLLTKAKSEYDKYDFTNGKLTLREAYKIDKNNPATLRGLGCLELFNKNFNRAIQYYLKALKYSENKETEYTLIGMAYYLQDKTEDAVNYFNLAIDENDSYTSAYEGRNQAMLENHLKITDLQDSLKKYF